MINSYTYYFYIVLVLVLVSFIGIIDVTWVFLLSICSESMIIHRRYFFLPCVWARDDSNQRIEKLLLLSIATSRRRRESRQRKGTIRFDSRFLYFTPALIRTPTHTYSSLLLLLRAGFRKDKIKRYYCFSFLRTKKKKEINK